VCENPIPLEAGPVIAIYRIADWRILH